MANIITVVYSNEACAEFDEQYYVQNHMPFTFRLWQRYGLESWSVKKYLPGPDGKDPDYRISCDLIFRDEQGVEESMQSPELSVLMQDVPSYTKLQPVFHYASAVTSSSG